MPVRPLLASVLLGAALSACATTPSVPPAEAIRYHLGGPFERGTVAVQPVGAAPASLEYQAYADAVARHLAQIGYTPVPAATSAQYVATVSFARENRVGPPRSSGFSIGLGGGSFGGGRHGGVGLGGGIGIPIGGRRRNEVIVSELSVVIARRADQTRVWEGQAHSAAAAGRSDADAPAQAEKLATAVFAGFPGESGRTITVP